MRTYFILDKNRVKISIIPAKSVQWNMNIYQPGSFSVEIPYDMYLAIKDDMQYVYRDGGWYLGLIQKYEYSYTQAEGKTVKLSGSFMEALLNNIPATMSNPLRQLDSVDGLLIYDTAYQPPTGYSKKIAKECVAIFFQAGKNASQRIKEACLAAAQLFKHEIDKTISKHQLPIKIFAFDELEQSIILQSALDKIDEEDESGNFTVLPDPEGPDKPDDGKDDQGRQYFKVKKGESAYLGDLMWSWLNGYFVNAEHPIDGSPIPPFHQILVCMFNPETGKITLKISQAAVAQNKFEFSEEKKNINSFSISQDISQDSAACVCTAVYLEDATLEDGTKTGDKKEDVPANYKLIQGTAIRNQFDNFHNLPLKGSVCGKLDIQTDYLGNTFIDGDCITENDCVVSVKDALANYNNYEASISIKLEPLFENVENYELYFHVGDFVKVNGDYMRVVGVDESISDGVESLSLTMESSEKGPFKCFIDRTTTPFRDLVWKLGT